MSKYLNKIKKRGLAGLSQDGSDGVLDLSGPIESGVVESGQMTQDEFDIASREKGGVNEGLELPNKIDWKEAGLSAAKTAAKGGSGEDVVSSGLMATGNPYAIAAGLALSTISSAQKAKQQRRMKEYEDAIAKANQRRTSLENLANIGQRMSV